MENTVENREPVTLDYAASRRLRPRTIVIALIASCMFAFGGSIMYPMLFGCRCHQLSASQICTINLRSIGQACYIYAYHDPAGAFPIDIADCIRQGNATSKQFQCPSNTQPGTSYFYVTELTIHSDLQSLLMYENPQNHPKEGAAVLFVDGHTEVVDKARLQALIQRAQASHQIVQVPNLAPMEAQLLTSTSRP